MTATDTFRRGLKSQLGWYLVVGGVGFGVDAAAYLLLAHGLGWPLVPARLLAFLPATVVTWWINRRLTFARTGEAPGQRLWEYLRYLAVQGTGIAVNFAVFHGVASQYPDHDLAAFAAGSAVALAFNFAGARWLVFTGRQGGVAFPAVVAFGVLSVVLGQDANWDFANYHLYNAYAVIHGRLLTDFAAAGLQTYFNPLLDVPYYLMTVHLSAPVVAFVMGVAHGLVVPLAAAIGRQVMPAESNRTLWLLAVAGGLGAYFISELGSTMGDNTTAPLVLAALLLVLRDPVSARSLMAAGLLVGVATGAKLTNAPYAVGLAAALWLAAGSMRERLRGAALLTLAGVAGLLLASGWWWWKMQATFGNPLFPQFNSVFGSPLAAPISVADTRWGPKNALEAAFYPFVFAARPKRMGEISIVSLLWPVVYAVGAATVVLWLSKRRQAARMDPRARGLLAFLAVGYAAWLAVFAIGRYTVAMEVLLPLVLWLLVGHAWPAARTRRVAAAAIAMAVLASVVPMRTWGHAPYAARSYEVQPLPLNDPSRATVLFIAQPTAWMAPFHPPEIAFASLFNFPESPGSTARVRAIIDSRGGEVLAVIPAATDTAANTMARINAWARDNRIAADGLACRVVHWWARSTQRYRSFEPAADGPCRFEQPPALRRDTAAEDRALAQQWAGHLAQRRLALRADDCQRHESRIGGQAMPYQVCRVER